MSTWTLSDAARKRIELRVAQADTDLAMRRPLEVLREALAPESPGNERRLMEELIVGWIRDGRNLWFAARCFDAVWRDLERHHEAARNFGRALRVWCPEIEKLGDDEDEATEAA